MSEAESAPKTPGKRGRRSETPGQRLERLTREMEAAKLLVKETERRKFAIVGEALLAEADADPALKDRVVSVLRARVTTATARADIATLLV